VASYSHRAILSYMLQKWSIIIKKMKEKILYLTLKKKWFDLIKSGEKKVEYREIKPYWTKRLTVDNTIKHYDYIIFRNGYKKSSPKLKVEYLGLGVDNFEGKRCYAIQLGERIE